MMALMTYMDSQGFAYPSQRTWTNAARMSRNTLTKQIALARTLGWLGVEERGGGQSWKQHVYRAAIPDDVVLDEKAEAISDCIASEVGNVEPEAGSPSVSHVSGQAGSYGGVKLAQSEPEAGSNAPEAGSASVSLNSKIQRTLKRTLKREAPTRVGDPTWRSDSGEPDAEKKFREAEDQKSRKRRAICDLLGKGYTARDIVTFTVSFRTTLEEVSELEKQWRQSKRGL
jgi:hypothetical protein